jgi:hypothetical protein
MPTSTRSETKDRVGSFFISPERRTYLQASRSFKNTASRDVLPAGIVREFGLHGARGTDGNYAASDQRPCERRSTYEEISVHPRFPVWLPPQPPESRLSVTTNLIHVGFREQFG